MANLEKELKLVSKTKRGNLSAVDAVAQTQRLIADGGAEDMGILREMGMHHSVIQAQDIHAKKIEMENLDEKYGKVFTIEEIKSLAKKYGLRFLRSDEYKGNVDPVMLQKIKEFFNFSDIERNNARLGFSMFILAPHSTFRLKPPANKPVRDPDPLLFYKLDNSNYRLIHKWGADLTFVRRIVGWKYATVTNYITFWTVLLSIIPLSLISSLTHSYWSLLAIAPAFVTSILMGYAGEIANVMYHEESWKSSEKNRI